MSIHLLVFLLHMFLSCIVYIFHVIEVIYLTYTVRTTVFREFIMKKTFRRSSRLWALLATLSALLLGIWGYFLFQNLPIWQFQHMNQQFFTEEMTSNTLNMHYTIAYPQNFGITDYEAILPAYDKNTVQLSAQKLEVKIQLYENLNASKLSSEDARTLNLLKQYLNTVLNLSKYPYHEEPLSPSSGMQSQLPILLAEYTFRCSRDVDDYLAILSQTGDYFSSLLEYETEKKQAGLLSAASSLRNTADQCEIILTKESLAEGSHFLQITFKDRLETLGKSNILTDAQIQDYIMHNDHILTTILLPAYESLAQGLRALADPAIPLSGLASKQDGADYYEVLLRSETGSYRTIEEITSILSTKLSEEFQALQDLLSNTDPTLLTPESYQSCDEFFPLSTCEDMLLDLRGRMSGQFPPLTSAADNIPSIHIKEISPCLEEYCAPAFYLTPPLDDSLYNSIYINTKTPLSAIELYTTLAHEGFPGHLYQTVYSNRLQSESSDVPIQQLLWFGGYLEGWALYVEFLTYDHASDIMIQADQPQYADLIQIEKHNRSTQLCLFALLDILIHHENADLAKTAEVLASFGITNSASVSNIYEYIVEEPANYPKYYLGYLEILLLKDACRQKWGDDYSDYAFHKFFLDNGPADFETLGNLIPTVF